MKRLSRPRLGVAVLAVAVTQAGCNVSQEPEFQTPRPNATKYETPRGDEAVVIQAADLGVDEAVLAAEGEKILEADASVGRFPAGLAVAYIEAATDDQAGSRHIRVNPVSDHRGVYWSQIMDDLPPVREVTMLRPHGLDPRGTGCRNLLRSAARLGCTLCVIYGQVADTEADAEYIGVLWDTISEKPLATYRTPILLTDEDRARYAKSLRRLTEEAEFRAEGNLRRLVRDTVWELVQQDAPVPTTQPSPWRTDLPLYPRDYDRHLRKLLEKRPRN